MGSTAKQSTSRSVIWLLVSAGIMLTAPLFGLLGTTLQLGGSFSSSAAPGVEPSAKARVLAEGISTAMNCMALGAVASMFALPLVVFFAVRWYRESKAARTKLR
jgi:biopolymer transport protein ExbB/TolQ